MPNRMQSRRRVPEHGADVTERGRDTEREAEGGVRGRRRQGQGSHRRDDGHRGM